MISVVMPVYNGARYLRQAIDSILGQSYRNFELIVLNDGSKDDTDTVISSYDDGRIVYIKDGENIGLSKRLNQGVAASRGKYIARMDADDISYRDRLKKQFKFLETHISIGILGTAILIMDKDGIPGNIMRKAPDHIGIKWSALFSTPLFHPTIMARAEILKKIRITKSLRTRKTTSCGAGCCSRPIRFLPI